METEKNIDEVLDVKQVRVGLRDLRARMPGQPDHLYVFAELLADYMNDELYPSAMRLTVALLMGDLYRGKSGWSSITIPETLACLPPIAFGPFELMIPDLLRAAAEDPAVAELLIRGIDVVLVEER